MGLKVIASFCLLKASQYDDSNDTEINRAVMEAEGISLL